MVKLEGSRKRPFLFEARGSVLKALHRFLPPLALLALGALFYWPGLGGGFIFDDYPNLVEDPDWKLTSLGWEQLRGVVGSGIASSFGRPLAVLSFALNHYFTGIDPWPMKLTGVALHLLNAALVYQLCRRLFALLPASAGRLGTYAAWLLALAWMLHPLQASTVLYVVQRMEVGAHTGVLLALLAYLNARQAQRDGVRSWPWWGAAVTAGLIGLGFKESALLLPVYALALEVCLLRFAGKHGSLSRGLIALYVVGAAGALAVFCWKILPGALGPQAYAFRDYSLVERLLSQLAALILYLRQILFAWPETLRFYYDNFPVSKGLFTPLPTFWGLICAVLLLGAGWVSRRRWPLTSLGLAWFFIAHALTSNVVPLELVFEHRNYFALLGILLALVQPLSWLARGLSPEIKKLAATLPVLFVTAMGLIQVMTWGDQLGLSMSLASRNPDSSRASYELGRLLIDRAGGDVESPLWSLAEQEFHHAAQVPGGSPLPEQALIILSASHGRPLPDDVWPSFRAKLTKRRAGPQEQGALKAVVDCRISGRCRFEDEQQLFDTLQKVLRANPHSALMHAIYGNYAFNVMRDPELAVAMLREAVRLAPAQLAYRTGLARFLVASNLRDSPEVEDALARLRSANAWGQYDEDLGRLEELLRNQGDGESLDR